MADLNKVLVMEDIDGKNVISVKEISEDSIPETLNGENGFHIYHVRMLTELILTEVAKAEPSFNLSDADIDAMSVASSLHDVGKRKVPESILNFPGKLSPIEYDIIKKHSAFGEEIIAGAESDVDPVVLAYAKKIARNHHERFDGSGYPDALKGDEISICAQAVSIADAFDALTSSRSYKKAFSQDVAIEMIANGMSGNFSPLLVECLLRVVNNNVLVRIRQKISEKRSVISDVNQLEVKRALLIGNTGYVTEEFIDEAFFNTRVIVAGETGLTAKPGLKIFNIKKPDYEKIFNTYEFDVIIYFAAELTYNKAVSGDASELRTVLRCVSETQKDSKFIYFSSLDAALKPRDDRAILSESKESLCEYYRNNNKIDLKIVRIPYLYNSAYENDFLYSIFDEVQNKRVFKIREKESARAFFISMTDLAELVEKFQDNWKEGNGVLTVNDEFGTTFADIAEGVRKLVDGAMFDFSGELESKQLNATNRALKNEYGWFSKISVVHELEEQYEIYLKTKNIKLDGFWDKLRELMRRHTLLVKILELFCLFFLTEILLDVTASAIIFSIVDFRMVYIVIMAITHGLPFGMAAAGLSSISWFFAKIESGTNWLTIFYEPSNWLAFIFFFLIGAVCGYIKLKKDNSISELTDQGKLLEEKLVFTRELYNDTFAEKKLLKKQIIGSKDSFGKIFDITKQLDTVDERELYLRIMDTFENVLENRSISVYSVTENSYFARLEVASKDVVDSVARSVSLDKFKDVVEVLEKNDIWKNTSFVPGLPMYASGVFRKGKLELLILMWYASADQRSLYYVNLFKILCNLVEMSLFRAYDYNNAVRETQYMEGTHIMNAENYERNYDYFRKMSDRKVFSYIQLEVERGAYSYEEIDKMFQGKIRANDIIGVTKDGNIRILLSQATQNDLEFILPRFERLDVEVRVLDK